jgi:hypothetical protein
MADIRQRVSESIRREGTAKVARDLGVSREAVLAYAGNFPRQAGTDAVIEARVDRLAEAHG